MFTLTPNAAEQILRAAAEQDDAEQELSCLPRLRVAAKIEEGEIVYGMGFDDQREHDVVIEASGVTLLIAPRSHELLDGATLDFVELRPGEFQFIFISPNEPAPESGGGCASKSSGCGSCGGGSSGGCN